MVSFVQRSRIKVKSKPAKSLAFAVVLIGALCLVVGASGILTKSGLARIVLWRMFAETATDLHIVQGAQRVLFTTPQELHDVRIADGKCIKDVPIRVLGTAVLGPLSFPDFYICSSHSGVPMIMFAHAHQPSARHHKRYVSDWQWVWWYDMERRELRPLVKPDGYIAFPSAFNLLDGCFGIQRYDPPDTCVHTTATPMLLCVDDGSWKEITSPSKILKRGMILLKDGGHVTLAKDDSEESCYLAHDGQRVISRVENILGATPDLKWVFFTRVDRGEKAETASLWAYDVKQKNARMLLDRFVGERFRVTQDSSSFGFLLTRPYDGFKLWTGWNEARKIVGACLYDLRGNLVEHIAFKSGLKGYLLGSMYDWDPTARIIAYCNPPHVIIRSLDGKVLAKLKLHDKKAMDMVDERIKERRN